MSCTFHSQTNLLDKWPSRLLGTLGASGHPSHHLQSLQLSSGFKDGLKQKRISEESIKWYKKKFFLSALPDGRVSCWLWQPPTSLCWKVMWVPFCEARALRAGLMSGLKASSYRLWFQRLELWAGAQPCHLLFMWPGALDVQFPHQSQQWQPFFHRVVVQIKRLLAIVSSVPSTCHWLKEWLLLLMMLFGPAVLWSAHGLQKSISPHLWVTLYCLQSALLKNDPKGGKI